MSPARPNEFEWDQAIADELIGSTVLIGLTYVKQSDPSVSRQYQMFGTIESADREKGITVRLIHPWKGQAYTIPPAPRTLTPAEPGDYRLRSTGETIVDPDYLTSWTIDAPPEWFPPQAE